MIKISSLKDAEGLRNGKLYPYVSSLLKRILRGYKGFCEKGNIDRVGAIYIVESPADFDDFSSFGLSSPITEKRFEYIIVINDKYCDGCIVLNNDYAVNIIGTKDCFSSFLNE